ncbi:MAG: 16S rRNA processing protein RimM [Acidobacteriota bacterium]|nr:16S rRNA processing protein RimM [Acidobacteriota bacterium]MDE3044203.1 16S rRNA processing protein RimM [Acidobacteriota bacterium]MDE3222706.1 16S rRNA processing protein RimM [Acidobacteriota bacterium]
MTRDTLEVGRIVKPHGLKGHVLVDLWSDREERLDQGATLQSERGPLVVESAARHQDRFLVKFDRISSREESERWRGVVLSGPRLNVPDALWIDELFDCEVVDQHGVRRGRVREVEANPASDLLVLDSGALVPLTFVVRVEANVLVEIDAPEGLFE